MPEIKGFIATEKGTRSVQRKLYTEEEDPDEEEREKSKNNQAGNRFAIGAMHTKWVTAQNVFCFREEVQEGRSPGSAVSWRQDVCPQATAVEESHG